jgi:uncharacterized protein YbbK (DUF523 family)
METILVSACLLGIECAWNGKSKPSFEVIEMIKDRIIIPVCAEQLAGFPTPREPKEIEGGSGESVLDGKRRVVSVNREDYSEKFIKGANEVLKIANLYKARIFIGRHNSPSCGCGKTYDGTFSCNLINGDGVTTALLKCNGIKVISDFDVKIVKILEVN